MAPLTPTNVAEMAFPHKSGPKPARQVAIRPLSGCSGNSKPCPMVISRHEPKAAARLMALLVCAVLIAVLASAEARGQDASLNIPGAFKNSVGIGGGGGFSYNSDSPNLSVSVDYGRALGGPWDTQVGRDRRRDVSGGDEPHLVCLGGRVEEPVGVRNQVGVAGAPGREAAPDLVLLLIVRGAQ